MRTTNQLWKICPFCGNKYIYKTITSDDGFDWEGHKRGTPYSNDTKEYCACGIEKALELNLQKIKPMCMNCKFVTIVNDCYYCTNFTNIDKINTLSDLFTLNTEKLKIKSETSKCSLYEFDISKLNLQLNSKLEFLNGETYDC